MGESRAWPHPEPMAVQRADIEPLRSIQQVLLDPERSRADYQVACESLFDHCRGQLPAWGRAPSALHSGLALSPDSAAHCLLDGLRTARLAQALDTAVSRSLRRRGKRGVEVLYAGCGPLAPLALLVAARHSGQALRFTLVDVHADALVCASLLFERAGLAHCLRQTICADAARLELDPDWRPHILVAEVMQRALGCEPQLAVMANLHAQCAADVVLVPSRIRVSATLARLAPATAAVIRARPRFLVQLLELSRTTLPALTRTLTSGVTELKLQDLRIPEQIRPDLRLKLRTRIQAGPGLSLRDDDSGLTQPHLEMALGPLIPGETLSVVYQLGPRPGFRISRRVRPAISFAEPSEGLFRPLPAFGEAAPLARGEIDPVR